MKEIDLVPEWYKSGRRRHVIYLTQYAVLCCLAAAMIVWNIFDVNSISKAEAQLAELELRWKSVEGTAREFSMIENEIEDLKQKICILEEIDSRIDITYVLAEIRYLVDEKTVLVKVELKAQKLADAQKISNNTPTPQQMARLNANNAGTLMGNIKYKVVIGGLSTDASNVADFIVRLEESPYFWKVYPSFSRNSRLTAQNRLAKEDAKVSEFEIVCYLANYQNEAPAFAGTQFNSFER